MRERSFEATTWHNKAAALPCGPHKSVARALDFHFHFFTGA